MTSEPLTSEEIGHQWYWSAHIDDWAFLLRIRGFTDPWGFYLSMQFLCFTLSYERWKQ